MIKEQTPNFGVCQTVKKLIHCERKGTGQYFGLRPKPPTASGYLSGTVQYFGLWPKPPPASGYLSGTIQYFGLWPKPPPASGYLSGT